MYTESNTCGKEEEEEPRTGRSEAAIQSLQTLTKLKGSAYCLSEWPALGENCGLLHRSLSYSPVGKWVFAIKADIEGADSWKFVLIHLVCS